MLIPGVGVSLGGARRWFRIGALSFQPSELAKFALILYLADFLNRKGYGIKDLSQGYIPCFGIVSFLSLLILLQPDLGTSVSIFYIGLLIIFIGGGTLKHILTTLLLGLPLLAYMILSVPYRRRRLLVFLNPWHDIASKRIQPERFLAIIEITKDSKKV